MKFIETVYGHRINAHYIRMIYVQKEADVFYVRIDLEENTSYTHSHHKSEEEAQAAIWNIVSDLEN